MAYYNDVKISLSSSTVKMTAENVRTINGKDGQDGKSAYEIAVDSGYVGTEEEWLASLKGKDGEQGIQGIQGETGATGAAGKDGKDGATGANGQDGANGKSAYEIAVDSGYSGTETEWLASLKGEKGDTGATGAKGDKGDTGSIKGLPAGFGEGTGVLSLKMNNQCTASGYYSVAEGNCTTASGDYSHTSGCDTIAASPCQFVMGKGNIADENGQYLVIVGNGNTSIRSNAAAITTAGAGWFKKSIKIYGKGYDDENAKEVATKEYVDSAIDNKLNSIVNGDEVSY